MVSSYKRLRRKEIRKFVLNFTIFYYKELIKNKLDTKETLMGKLVGQRLLGLDLLRVFLAVTTFMFHSSAHFKCYYGIINGFVSGGGQW